MRFHFDWIIHLSDFEIELSVKLGFMDGPRLVRVSISNLPKKVDPLRCAVMRRTLDCLGMDFWTSGSTWGDLALGNSVRTFFGINWKPFLASIFRTFVSPPIGFSNGSGYPFYRYSTIIANVDLQGLFSLESVDLTVMSWPYKIYKISVLEFESEDPASVYLFLPEVLSHPQLGIVQKYCFHLTVSSRPQDGFPCDLLYSLLVIQVSENCLLTKQLCCHLKMEICRWYMSLTRWKMKGLFTCEGSYVVKIRLFVRKINTIFKTNDHNK